MNLELSILNLLNESPNSVVGEKYLFNSLNIDLPQAVTYSALRLALKNLEAQKQVVSVKDEDRGAAPDFLVWQITSIGRARTAK